MHVRRARQSLLTLAATCTVSAVGVLAWAVCSPVGIAPPTGLLTKRQVTFASPKDAATDDLTLAAFSTLWDKHLQTPLREGAAGPGVGGLANAQASRQQPPLAFVLVGTMIEAEGQSRAMFSVPPGNIELKAVGESVGVPPAAAEVLAIDPKQVTLRYQGKMVTLRLKGADEG